jgi:hypothetical protein
MPPPGFRPPPGYPAPPPGYRRPEGFFHRQARLGMERKARQLRWGWPILVAVAVIGLLAMVGSVIFQVVRHHAEQAPPSARQTVSTFLHRLVLDDLGPAHDSLCDATRAKRDRSAFAAYVKAHELAGFADPAAGTPSSAASVEYYVLRYVDGTSELHGVPVVQEAGVFRVCGDPY